MTEVQVRADPKTLRDAVEIGRRCILLVPLSVPFQVSLHRDYLLGCADKVGLYPHDVIELRPTDLTWRAQLLVLSSIKTGVRSVVTHVLMPPTFLLDPPDRNPSHIVERINALHQDFQDRKVDVADYPQRLRMLECLRDHQRYPSDWLAGKLVELQRAFDAQ